MANFTTPNTSLPTEQTPTLPMGPLLHPEQMRQTGTRPSSAMAMLVAEKTRTDLSYTELAPGVWEVASGRPGPRCAVVGGVHGNEPSGVFTVMRLLLEYTQGDRQLENGSVVLAVGNEDAVMANKRETVHNLNRLFHAEPKEGNDPELKRARELRGLLFEPGSFLLDLHSTSRPSKPFVVVETSNVGRASWVPVDTVLCGTGEHFDRYLPGTTQRYSSRCGVTGFTLECGQHDEASTAEVSYRSANAFLTTFLSDGGSVSRTTPQLVVEFNTVVYKTDDTFRFSRTFEGFDTVSRGELLGSGELGEHRASEDCVVVFPTDPTKVESGGDLYFLGRQLS